MNTNTNTHSSPVCRVGRRVLAALALASGAWALSSAVSLAQARDDVYWSIGVNSPGVSVGVSNAPQVVYGYPVYEPRPVVVYPRPVVVQTVPVYRTEYYQPQWREPRHHKRWHRFHHQRDHRHGGGRRWDD